MSALDLFCGAAGGWSVALDACGIETVAACEIDDWRRSTFSKNFPGVKMYADIRQLSADRLLADLGYLPDIIVGSPPCQDASVANNQGKGVDGERTGLFFEGVRLVRELRPDWVCFENVPGLKSRGYDRIQDELEAAGYTVWPLVVGAWHAGAPHRRNRVWIAAIKTTDAALMQRSAIARDQSNGLTEIATPDAEAISGRRGPDKPFPESALARWKNWNGGPPKIGRVDDGLPRGMARKMLRAYGDGVVPQVAAAVIKSIQAVINA